MIEHLQLRHPGEPQAIRKRSTILDEAFFDMARSRARRIIQPLDVPVVAPEVRREQKQLDAQVQLVGEPPGRDLGDMTVDGHAAASSNRIARWEFAFSGAISRHRGSHVAESAMRISDER